MSFKIVVDSCCDLTPQMKKEPCFVRVPMTIQVDGSVFVDDETFDQKRFLELAKASPNCPKTACPSPETFKQAFTCDAEDIFVITLSSHLSGSYNSAVLAKSLYEEEYGKKNILVLDSKSASSGQLNIAMYIRELCDQGLEFDEICEKAAAYRDRMNTYFVLESLDTLKKNGRLTGLQAFFATKLNIKPVMGADNGTIIKLDQARGIQKALQRMAEIAVKEAGTTKDKRLVIAHCNNRARAEYVRDLICSKAQFKDVVITDTAGVATVYANDGGIILTL
mgnify:CR=1 FL=1